MPSVMKRALWGKPRRSFLGIALIIVAETLKIRREIKKLIKNMFIVGVKRF